jgi:glycosyltransferase involved in cell wall biosynthesis
MNPVLFVSNKINRKSKEKYDILTFSTHEAYQEAMARTGHNFFLLEMPGSKKWNEEFRKLPKNCVIVTDFEKIPSSIDFIISQERYSQIQNSKNLANALRLPLIHIDHVEPINNPALLETINIKADLNVCITEHNKESWKNKDAIVINHGIDTNVFSGWKPNGSKEVVYTVNYLRDRDFFCGHFEWEYVKNKATSIDPKIKFTLIGDNPGISRPISDPNKIAEKIKNSACYINTSKFSPVPMSLLEAMSCGTPIVSTRYQEVAKILNEENSVSSNDLDVLAEAVVKICNNEEGFESIGSNARRFIESNYSMETFIHNWNSIFNKAYNQRLGTVNEIFYIK